MVTQALDVFEGKKGYKRWNRLQNPSRDILNAVHQAYKVCSIKKF